MVASHSIFSEATPLLIPALPFSSCKRLGLFVFQLGSNTAWEQSQQERPLTVPGEKAVNLDGPTRTRLLSNLAWITHSIAPILPGHLSFFKVPILAPL